MIKDVLSTNSAPVVHENGVNNKKEPRVAPKFLAWETTLMVIFFKLKYSFKRKMDGLFTRQWICIGLK